VNLALAERPPVEPALAPFEGDGGHVHSRTRVDALGQVFSQQWLFVPGGVVPVDLPGFLRAIDRAYYGWIERTTGGTVEIVPRQGGGLVARVVPIGPVGLRLGPAHVAVSESRGETARPILSGVLVAAESGELGQGIQAVPGGAVVWVDLRRFRPRLLGCGAPGRYLYARGQAVVHRRLSNAFLRHDVAPRIRGQA
jgi:hypothetical protein